jgi:hypothetical protein
MYKKWYDLATNLYFIYTQMCVFIIDLALKIEGIFIIYSNIFSALLNL